MPTSKPIAELLARTTPELIVLDGDRAGASPRWSPRPSSTPIRPQTARAIAARSPRRAGDSPPLGRGLAPRRPRRGRGDGRLAGRARRAVRGRAVPGARGRPAGRVHAVGRQLDAGPRHGRLAAVDGARDHGALEPRRERDRRRRVDDARVGRGRRRRRWRSSWATCRSSTTSTRSSPRSSTTCPRRSSSSTTTAAASSRSSRRRRPPSPGPASRTGTRSCSGRRTGSTSRRS